MIDRPTAGPEMDRLVQSRVLGVDGPAPAYSIDIAAAWELWKKLPRPKRLHVDTEGVHHCMCGGSDRGADGSFEPAVWEKADKMAMAICLAALRWRELSEG